MANISSLYDTREFESREAAGTAASTRAHVTIGGKFPEYADQELDWDVVEEGGPLLTAGQSAPDSTQLSARDEQAESSSLH